MDLKEGSDVAVIVDGKWHAALCKSLILPSEASSEPFHTMFGKVSEWSANVGMWLLPERQYANVGLTRLFIPWHSIVSVAVIEEGKRNRPGFATSA